ncbi:uncharacterized protein LOC141811903 isoform X2 [Curcuma longa]|uniref:uncharacterized protein LOC141811903 isoform X2 n=1 Tax=Curcuma longa TaxID=136217 RepID=UPI003D9F155D
MDLRSSLPKSDEESLSRRVGDGDGRSAALILHLLSSLENGESSFQLVEGGLGASFPSIIISNRWFETRIRFSDIAELSDFLFDKLQDQFDWLLSGMSHPGPSTFTRSYKEEPILLFRCCMHILPLLEFNLSLVVEKCAVLLSILRRLCSPGCRIKELNEEARRQMLPFFCRVLEVFVEEFLMDSQIRKHVMMTDKISSTAEKIFVYDGSCELVVKYKEMIGPSPQVKTAKAIIHRSPSSVIASNFQEYRMVYSRSTRKIGKEQASEGDTCNGDNFLQCYLPGYQQNSAAFSDLADFIECKPGVDYSRWLKNRRRFNKWLQKKRHRLHPIGSDR